MIRFALSCWYNMLLLFAPDNDWVQRKSKQYE